MTRLFLQRQHIEQLLTWRLLMGKWPQRTEAADGDRSHKSEGSQPESFSSSIAGSWLSAELLESRRLPADPVTTIIAMSNQCFVCFFVKNWVGRFWWPEFLPQSLKMSPTPRNIVTGPSRAGGSCSTGKRDRDCRRRQSSAMPPCHGFS